MGLVEIEKIIEEQSYNILCIQNKANKLTTTRQNVLSYILKIVELHFENC